jgi:hypothetical protein
MTDEDTSEAEDRRLEELRGHPIESKDDKESLLMELTGILTRARFEHALRQVEAEPDRDLTRARVLARARQLSLATASGRVARWPGLLGTGVGGIAAGIVGAAIILHGGRGAEFGSISGSEELVASGPTKSIEEAPHRFRVHAKDPNIAASALVQRLTLAGATFTVEHGADDEVFITIRPLSTRTAAVKEASRALRLDLPLGVPLLIEFRKG